MNRFIIMDLEEARATGFDDPEELTGEWVEDDWFEGSILVDTQAKKIVFSDQGIEPEDATLGRDYARLVKLLNEISHD